MNGGYRAKNSLPSQDKDGFIKAAGINIFVKFLEK